MSCYIKFCGMTELRDIEYAIDLGVDAIGLVLVPGSPRCLSVARAAEIRKQIPISTEVFALVRDAESAHVAEIFHHVAPHFVQFHGSESAEFCESFARPYCKALSLADPDLTDRIDEFAGADLLIFDGHAPGAMGGSGETGDWQHYPAALGPRAMLAGGLKPSNVADAIRISRCVAVDVSSGIETAPGIKSNARMAEFVHHVRTSGLQ